MLVVPYNQHYPPEGKCDHDRHTWRYVFCVVSRSPSLFANVEINYTGTGNGLKPPQFLTPGTVMEVKVSKIGTLRNGVTFD